MIDGKEYVHLHVHTEYSLGQATCRLEKLFQKVKLMNMKALAITDINSINGVIRFLQLAKAYDIRPIIGCELSVGKEENLVLLAVSYKGYEQILRWINFGFSLQQFSKGEIIALSGGIRGSIYQLLKEKKRYLAKRMVQKYIDSFGNGNFYLEIQNHFFEDDDIVIQETINLSKEMDVPVVATHNIHYLEPEDAVELNIIRNDKGINISKTGPFYFPSQEEMSEKFWRFPNSIHNTYVIAKRCNYKDYHDINQHTSYPFLNSRNHDSYLKKLCFEGLYKYFDFTELSCKEQAKIIGRLNYELNIISRRKLSPYFLIVWDIVNFARKRKISIGPGRGSSTGSLVAFLLGITQVNPILYKLSFERFLSLDRSDIPDIDIDVCRRRRNEILEYLKKKYGNDKVVHLGVCNTFGTRGSIRKAGEFLNLKKQQIDVIASLLPAFSGTGGLRHCLETLPELKKLPVDKEPYKSLFHFAQKIEGLPNNYSSHPSAVLIGDRLPFLIPIKLRNDGDSITTFNKEDIKELGLLKYDLLGLRNLTIIDDTLGTILKEKGKELRVENIGLNDKETFLALKAGNTLGCFQLESMGIRYLLRKMQPKTIEELAILLALYRPGAWKEGIIDTYLKRRDGKEKYNYILSQMEDILSSTYGLIIYQEQVMDIAHVIAGYSMGEADILRRVLAKKHLYSIEEYKKKFILGASKKGYKKQQALRVFNFLERFSGYSFNKAHSISYAYISYWTVYLKTHYPKEYMASLLSLQGGYFDRRVYIREVKKMGITLLCPDVNKSGIGFQVEKQGIRVGMDAIKGSGANAVSSLIHCRKDGKFISFEDFLTRIQRYQVNRSVLKVWVFVGACDNLDNNRKKMINLLTSPQINIFEYLTEDIDKDYSQKQKGKLEKEYLGYSLKKVATYNIKHFLNKYRIIPIENLWNTTNNKRVRIAGAIIHLRRQPTKTGEYLLIIVLQDHSEMVEILVYPKTYEMYLYELNPQGIIVEGILTNLDTRLYVKAEKIKGLGG
ncbi:DNA polymerase III subunit alpha [Vallitalea maricola]|uniref:DNA polymerase III subunit alpha n=1 Tax=Vallitalea maricola TaxID=3074433 RepID=A0ACB5UE72_9FIRM|nr:DNA polymerase III subunit alpha [Vallitalea sp. AN17-2]